MSFSGVNFTPIKHTIHKTVNTLTKLESYKLLTRKISSSPLMNKRNHTHESLHHKKNDYSYRSPRSKHSPLNDYLTNYTKAIVICEDYFIQNKINPYQTKEYKAGLIKKIKQGLTDHLRYAVLNEIDRYIDYCMMKEISNNQMKQETIGNTWKTQLLNLKQAVYIMDLESENDRKNGAEYKNAMKEKKKDKNVLGYVARNIDKKDKLMLHQAMNIPINLNGLTSCTSMNIMKRMMKSSSENKQSPLKEIEEKKNTQDHIQKASSASFLNSPYDNKMKLFNMKKRRMSYSFDNNHLDDFSIQLNDKGLLINEEFLLKKHLTPNASDLKCPSKIRCINKINNNDNCHSRQVFEKSSSVPNLTNKNYDQWVKQANTKDLKKKAYEDAKNNLRKKRNMSLQMEDKTIHKEAKPKFMALLKPEDKSRATTKPNMTIPNNRNISPISKRKGNMNNTLSQTKTKNNKTTIQQELKLIFLFLAMRIKLNHLLLALLKVSSQYNKNIIMKRKKKLLTNAKPKHKLLNSSSSQKTIKSSTSYCQTHKKKIARITPNESTTVKKKLFK